MQIWTHADKTVKERQAGATAMEGEEVIVTTELYMHSGDQWLKVSTFDRQTNELVEVICDFKIEDGFNQPMPIDIEASPVEIHTN